MKTLGVRDTKQRHDSESIAKILTDLLAEFNINKENVICCVVDNASNMTKTVQRLNEDLSHSEPEEEIGKKFFETLNI